MAFGATSSVFGTTITDLMNNTTAIDLNSDTINCALYGNTGTPDKNAASAAVAYNTGQWITGNEITATGWPAGGNALTLVTSAFAAGVYTYDVADRAGGASDTVTAAFGVEIYDFTIAAPVAKQGISFNAFGGSNSVSSGTFTVVFHVNGVFTATY